MRKDILVTLFLLFVILCSSFGVSAISITLNIPEKYSEVNAGERVYVETQVTYPENTQRKDLRIEYFVKDSSGKEVAYLKVLKAVETQASFMDSISIPESTPSGTYKIYGVILDYSVLNEEVAASFKITGKRNY